jgi:zinc protease
MKKIAISLSFILCAINVWAQEVDLNEPLPLNPRIKKGVLKNGMTYYISNSKVIKNVASYYIIQNVGSTLENDDQQGLAHFLEHMAFNGTKNFEGKGILNTLQKYGAVFGKDINAYTGFDETVYNMNNIPTDIDGLVDTCLLILHDWSNFLLLTEEEIDAERGVIKEEWRATQSGGMRVLKKSLPTLFNNSIYSKRLPIGLMEIVENFDYKALRDFYRDWYRTDLQAIAVVGDIDVEEVEQKIIDLFSNIESVENPKDRFFVNIPDNKELLYNLAMDKEVTTARISFSINHPRVLDKSSVGYLKESLITGVCTSLISARLRELSQKPEASFLAAYVGYGKQVRTKYALTVGISPKPKMQSEAFEEVMRELIRAVKFGFTQSEVDRSIAKILNSYENSIKKIERIPHASIIRDVQQNFLENEAMSDVVGEFELAKRLLNNTDLNEFHKRIGELYTEQNRILTITGVEGNPNLSKSKAVELIRKIENDTGLVGYSEDFSGKSLMSGLILEKGEILRAEEHSELNATTFFLSNGVKVHYKFVNKDKNDVKLKALSYGGYSLLHDSILPSAYMVRSLTRMSGLGNFNASDLRKMLAGKTVSANFGISDLSESILASSTSKDVESMLQLVHLRFQKPRFDQDSYEVLISNLKNSLIGRKENINSRMADSTTVTLYGANNAKKPLFSEAFIEKISYDNIKYIYEDRFKDASDFEFFIVGDVDENILKPWLEKYIASIPTSKTKENWVDNSVPWLKNIIDKDIYLEMENPKGSVRISFKNNMDYSLLNDRIASVLGDMLQLRFLETLREEEGGTYGAYVGCNMSKRPKGQAQLSVSFDCNPEKVEDLIEIVYLEIDKMKKGIINTDDLDKTLINGLKELKEVQDKNNYDMSLLTTYFREGYNINDPKNSEDIFNAIDKNAIQNFVVKLMDNAMKFEIVFKPKE